jgi:tripartite ATP-independent transporter DctP family solute receptor
MMLKKFRCLVLVMVLVLVIVSCTTFAQVKPIRLVYGNVYAPEHFYSKADLYFKELVEKNSKGKILIDYFPASQLGSEQEMLQATRSGGQQICQTTPGMLATFLPKLATLELPYLFRDQEHYLKVLSKGSSLIDQKEMGDKTNLRLLACRARAPRQLTTKFPVNKLNDIKGIKIRVSEVPLRVALWKALGTIPTPLPMGDVYTALATGTIDAQENPLDTIYSFNLFEQQKYIALTYHMREIQTVMINNKTWNSLTSSQKKILTAAINKSANMANKFVFDGEREYHDKLLQKGVKFTEPALEGFSQKAKTIWSQFGDKELINKVEAIK